MLTPEISELDKVLSDYSRDCSKYNQ